ncbi:MAG: hypothetical protein KJN77_06960 [Gammaproteobacteria bacterium]|nr:hypothetical protein [Gammaproteobacteria bacterium]
MSSSLRILTAGASWRLLGSRRAADVLLEAMSSGDEKQRMLAGMSLVKAGQRSFKLIENKIEAGEATAPIVCLLPDIGGEQARSVLERVAGSASAELKQAAGECLDLLDRIEELDKE